LAILLDFVDFASPMLYNFINIGTERGLHGLRCPAEFLKRQRRSINGTLYPQAELNFIRREKKT